MSNPLVNQIKQIMSDEIRAARSTLMSQIVSCDRASGLISVKPVGAAFAGASTADGSVSEGILENISILNFDAFKDSAPQTGDLAYIDFVNNDMSKAVVLTIIRQVNGDTYNSGKETQVPDYVQTPYMPNMRWG